LEKESVCFCTPSVQVKCLHPGPAGSGMRPWKRIRRPGADRAPAATDDAGLVAAPTFTGGGATDFCARFLDRNDTPLKNFAVNLDEVRK